MAQLYRRDLKPGDEFDIFRSRGSGPAVCYRITADGGNEWSYCDGRWYPAQAMPPEWAVFDVVRANPEPHAFEPVMQHRGCEACGNEEGHASHGARGTFRNVAIVIGEDLAADAPRRRRAAVKAAIANALEPKPVQTMGPGDDHASILRAGVAAMERRVAAERALKGPPPITCQPNYVED